MAGNIYLDLLEQQEQQRQQALSTGIAAAGTLTSGVNPDEAARMRSTAQFLGVPPAVVEAMPQDAERQARIRRIDTDTATAPALRQRYTDADFMKLASDDSGVLAGVESVLRNLGRAAVDVGKYAVSAPGAPGGGLMTDVAKAARAVASGVPQAGAGLYGAVAGVAGFTDQLVQTMDDAAAFVTRTPRRQIVGTPGPEGFFLDQQQRAKGTARDVMSPDPSAGFVEQSVMSGFQSAGQNLVTLPLGFAQRGQQIMLGVMGAMSGGQSYGEAREKGLSPFQAIPYAAQDATAEIVTERYLGAAGFLQQVKAGASAGKLFMYELLREVPGEMAATLWQNFNEWANVNPDKSVAQFVNEQPAALAQTVIATLVGGSTQIGAVKALERVGATLATEAGQAQRAEQAAAQVEQLAKLMEASKLRGRDAVEFSRFVAQIAEERGDAPAELYVDAQQLANVLNQSAMTLTELRAIAPAVADQLEAVRNVPGADVRVPVAELAAAGPDITTALLDHLREAPEAMSRAEAREFMTREGDRIQQEVEQTLARQQEAQAFRESRQVVEQDVLRQLTATGRFGESANTAYAALWSNFFATQAARIGVTPQELYERFGPRIVSQTRAGALLDQDVPLGSLRQGAPYESAPDNLMGFSKGAPKAFGAQRYRHVQYVEVTTSSGARHVDAVAGLNASHAMERARRNWTGAEVKALTEAEAVERDPTIADDVAAALKAGELRQEDGDRPEVTRGSFDPSTNTLALLAAADLSTFLHESGHFFLEVQADLAARIEGAVRDGAGVTESERAVVDDMNRILSWFGITDNPQATALQQWLEMTLDQKREHHEKWARGFERYLMEGQAPSMELQPLFARFRAWLVQVYRTLTNLNVQLSDDVREVMGRLLASDVAISEAQDARALGPLFRSPEQAGMTPEEYADYQATAERATARASAELDTRLMKDLRWLSRARDKAIKARQAEVDQLRREVEREVRADVLATPIYQAWQFLTGRSDRLEGGKAVKKVGEEAENLFAAIGRLGGLDAEQVKKAWGVSTKDDTIRSGIFGKPVLRKTGGLSIDAMAERLVEAGYLLPDQDGRADLAKFEALFDDQRRGVDRFSIRKDFADAQGEQPVEPLNLPSEFASGRLNTDVLKGMYGDTPDAKWRLLSERRMTSPTGLHPDVVAETFGFASGDQLVNQLVRARPPAEVIEELTDQQMLQRYGDIGSQQALERAADEAVHNELRARVIAQELKALAKANTVRESGDSLYKRETIDVMAKAAREFAERAVARQKIKDLRPSQYAAAEARSARLAEQALGKNTGEAAMHKRNQLVNNLAAKAALDAQREVQAGREFFRKVLTGAQDKVAKARDFDVVQAMRAILADYGIGTRGEATQRYLEAVQRTDPGMYQVLRDKVDALTLNAKPLNELTVEEFRGLVEELQGMWHLSKRSRQMEVDGQLIDLDRAKQPLVDRIEEIGVPDRVPGEGRAVTPGERRIAQLRSFGAALRRVESWVEAKDGQAMGPFRRFVWQPIKEAADRYRTDKAAYLKRYRDLLASVDVPVARIDAPELGYTFGFARGGSGKAEILHALLHTGNESNKRKMLLGRQWGQVLESGDLDTGRWDSFVNRMIREGVLTRRDFEFAQGVWDLLEEMKPLAQKAHRDVFGRYFDEVTAQSFTIQFPDGPAVFRGGYVPAVMDAEVVKDAATRALQEDENASLAFAFPSTPKGFTKARVEINRPLLLDLRYLAQHIDKVLLFSHLEQPIRDVRKILTSREVSEPLHRIDPTAYDGLLTPWMNRAARQTVETKVAGDNNLMRFFSKARARAGMAAMFANVANAAQQVTGLSLAAVKVRPALLLDAAVLWVKAPRRMAESVAEASPYMASRMDNEVAAMNEAIEQILLNPSVYERAQAWTARHAYFMQSAVDNVVGPIVWTGAYNQALEQGQSELDARRLADAAVRQTQGSTLPEDVSRFETGNAFVRLFTQFYGYFNMQANLLGTEFANIMHEQGLRRGMGRGLYVFAVGFLAPAMVAELIVQAFRGGPGDEDEDGSTLDDWLQAVLLMSNVRTALAMVPGVGPAITAGMNAFNSKPYDDRISTSPAISMIESAAKSPRSVYQAIADDGNRRTAVRDVATFISMTTGLPASAIARPLGYLAGVEQGTIDPEGPADAARGLVTGVPSPESKR